MIKLIAFDWNGTLLADTQMNLRCSNINFKNFNLKPLNILEFRKTFDIPVSKFWKKYGGKKQNLDKQAKKFHILYEANVGKTRTRAGSKRILQLLQNYNIKRMIYSNHVAPDIVKQLIRLNIFKYFDEILARPAGEHSQIHQRSKGKKLFDYVKRNRLKPKEVLTIGDTEEEIEIGKIAGYYTVAITGGYNTESRLKKQKPDFLIHNMKDLIPIVKKLNN